MRSRAAILPFPGDPFLLHYWLHFFDTVWSDEVDKLYIYLNSPIEEPVVQYIRELCASNPKINLQYNPVQIEHGQAIDRTLDIVSEEYIMLIEDDGFIFKKGRVDACFAYLESGQMDIVGSKRGSCSTQILERSKELYGLDYEGEGDQGPNFWPNFFFSKKELLLNTDRWFGARAWNPGEEIPPLGVLANDVVASDTFVNTSMQLLAMVPQSRIMYVPQYHGSPDDLDHVAREYNLFDGRAWWCHIGSLSSGVGGLLQDGHGRSLSRRLIDPDQGANTPIPNYCHTDQEKREFERRVQWWLTFWEKRDPAEIPEFAALYYNAVMRIISEYDLYFPYIERRQRAYANIGL